MINLFQTTTVFVQDHSNSGWLFLLIVLGPILLMALFYLVPKVVERIRQKIEERQKEKVVSTSLLYRKICDLNKSELSIAGKQFTYSNKFSTSVESYKEWINYDKKVFIKENKDIFERDLANLKAFIKDCKAYEECLEMLWVQNKANPESIKNSHLNAKRYVELEEELCRRIAITIPKEPTLLYELVVSRSYHKGNRHLNIKQSEIEELLSLLATKSESSPKLDNSDLHTASIMNADVQPSPEPRIVEVPTKQTTSKKETTKPIDEAFERFFNSTDNLESEGLFWAHLSEEEQSIIKDAAKFLFDLKANLIPINGKSTFGFRERSASISSNRSLFWFKKGSDGQMIFVFQKDPVSYENGSIIATTNKTIAIQEQILSLLDRANQKSPTQTQETPSTTESTANSVDDVPTKTEETATVSAATKNTDDNDLEKAANDNHKKVLDKFPELDLSNGDLFYSKMSQKSQEIIDEVLLLATKISRKVIAKNESGKFGFGHIDDSDNNYSWFGFRKRIGEAMCFFYKEDRNSNNVSTIEANSYLINSITSAVRTIINQDFLTSSRKPEIAKKEPIAEAQAQTDDYLPDPLSDQNRFYYNCSIEEKEIIIKISNLSVSLNKDITFGNTKSYFGFKKKWSKGTVAQYWYWFRKPDGKKMGFAYRQTQESPKVITIENAASESQFQRIERIVKSLLLNQPIESVQSYAVQKAVPKEIDVPSDLAISINDPSFFFRNLERNEQSLVVNLIKFIKDLCPKIRAENTKSFLGFRIETKDSYDRFWFWFKKPPKQSLQFVFKQKPSDSQKELVFVTEDSIELIGETLQQIILYEAKKAPSPQLPKNEPSSVSKSETADLGDNDDFWEKPYLYAGEIMKKCGINRAVATTVLSDICSTHHYTYSAGVAFNNKYESLADAIYQAYVVNSDNKIYTFSNPYDSKAYEQAIQKLKDELKLFELGEGQYMTNKTLREDYGLGTSDCHAFKEAVKKYISNNQFFTIENIREHCSECRFMEFDSSDRIILQFIRSIVGRRIKTIVTDQDSSKTIYSANTGITELKDFFLFLMEGAKSMDIYTIKDRVETLFAVNYSLDLIGKDAKKAGFFYSDDLEKVYLNKKIYIEEIKE